MTWFGGARVGIHLDSVKLDTAADKSNSSCSPWMRKRIANGFLIFGARHPNCFISCVRSPPYLWSCIPFSTKLSSGTPRMRCLLFSKTSKIFFESLDSSNSFEFERAYRLKHQNIVIMLRKWNFEVQVRRASETICFLVWIHEKREEPSADLG